MPALGAGPVGRVNAIIIGEAARRQQGWDTQFRPARPSIRAARRDVPSAAARTFSTFT